MAGSGSAWAGHFFFGLGAAPMTLLSDTAGPARRAPPLGRVYAVAVTFNSEADFARACAATLAEVDGLVIVDNGSGRETCAMLERIARLEPDRVLLIANERNIGLDRAQNQGIAAARARGADWILLLDHDSTPAPGMVAAFAQALLALADPRRVAVLAPRLIQTPASIETRYWLAKGRWGARRTYFDRPILDGALFVIASGSLIRVEALDAVGAMREDFFIDYIDVEFGLRLNRAGWRIVLVGTAELHHRLGEPSRHGLLGQKLKTTNHNAARRYTIFRNRARLWRAYGLIRPGWVGLDLAAAATDLFRILAFEDSKRAKLGRALAGLWAGVTSRRLDAM